MPPSPLSERVIIRPSASDSGYELELQSSRGFSARALPLWLKLGPLELRSPRESATVGEYGAVFQLSQSEFESLPEGAELVVATSASGQGDCLGRLDKSALSVR
jgi:hypothetical protein